MSKSRPAGKPAKLAGSGRKFVRSCFAEPSHLEENESLNISKEICFGLAIFRATFGCDDTERESMFHGFSPHEIRLATDKSQIRSNQVEKEHRARGVLFTPHTFGRKSLLPVSSQMTASNTQNSKVTPINHDQKIDGRIRKVLKPGNGLIKKVKSDIHSQKAKACIKQIVGSTSSESLTNSRAIAKGFVLPIRSAHSSRVIKPNKRFRDIDSDSGSCDIDEKVPKKIKLTDTGSTSNIHLVGKRTQDSSSDNESERGSSSMSTASSSVGDGGELYTKAKGKVILRKAKLKVEPDLPVIGPFSSVAGDPSLVPQKVVCGVCGAVRFYRYLKQARKFGIYSCESCRKFISRVITPMTNNILPCKLGNGTCTIPRYQKDPMTGEVSKNKRCKACWLKICLRCYCMPDDLISRLIHRLPLFMRSGFPSSEMQHKKKTDERRFILKRYNLKPSVVHSRLSDRVVEKKIILAKNIRKRAEEIVRKDSIANKELSTTIKRKRGRPRKVQPAVVSNKIKMKCNTLDITKKIKEKSQVKYSADLNAKQRKLKKDRANKREEKLIRLQKLNLKGPRVKHVCRSASLVLGQPVATFTDTSPSKQNSCSSVNNCDFEQASSSSLSNSSENNKQLDEYSSIISHKNIDQKSRIRQASSIENELAQAKSKYTASKKLISNDLAADEGLLEGKARTLQDLSRQHYELVNGASVRDDSSMISVAFWESYDPEEVCKTGFALIGISNSFDTKAICFICGSAGLERMIHCSCCCEPFHYYCVEGVSQDSGDNWWLVDWVCPQCTLCNTCGKGGGAQTVCQRCHKSHHSDCLAADRLHSADRPSVCLSCLCCKSCNKSEVYKFVGNLPLCQNCFRLRQKGNFCPLCQRCYDENDFDTKMMECERCKCWVHAKCEGLSNEKYQILSILPDSVEFICRKCSNIQPAPWWLAVESEMKAGLLAVLKSLSKSRKACDLLKWSPSKRTSMCACGESIRQRALKFPVFAEQSDGEFLDTAMRNEIESSKSEEVCLRKEQNFLSDSNKSVVNDSKSESLDRNTSMCEQRTNVSSRECPVLIKNEELQLRLDSDTISYQTSDEKAAQFSPHATSQSDSGIGSTDDELKSTNDKCFCVRLDTWTKTPPTLLTIKRKVNSNEYTSLGQFNKEMEDIIQTVQGTELLNLYYQSLEDVFPWFDPKSSEVIDQTTRINSVDTFTTAKFTSLEKSEDDELEKCAELKGKLNRTCDYYYNINTVADSRICVLCKLVGEGETTEEGRLLYCGQNDWVHTNCALWSNEVFEEIDGSLQNVQSAISRSRHIRCSKCSKKGASIGCCNRSCPEAYHFNCAKNSDCVFLEDKSLFCLNHKNDTKVVTRTLVTASDFVVSRPIYVELEQKKKKCAAKHNVQVMIGSLTINNLGEFVPDLSDQTYSIIPCNFQCTRLFWSSTEPWRLIHYTIKTKIVYTVSDTPTDNDKNITIDHSTQQSISIQEQAVNKSNDLLKNEIKEVVDFILESVCSKDEEDTQAPADLLPPELKQAIFEDLPHDILDGISMQDIFPKLMTLDFSSVETKPNLCREYQSTTKPKRLKLENSKPAIKKQSPAKLKVQSNVSRVKTNSQCSIILKRVTTIQSEGIKRVNTFEEKENKDDWSTAKILQIDGAGDCSESSDSGSPINDRFRNSFTVKKLFQTQTYRKPRILQVDGVDDSCCTSSSSSSECGSPIRDDNTSWKLGQVDGAMDFCNGNDPLEENPVKCTRCHRTYRTAQSFERHLQSCSADYILSCSESDSSEEDKVSSPEVECPVGNQVLFYNSETTNLYNQEEDINLPESDSNKASSLYDTPVLINTDSTNCIPEHCSPKVNGSDLFEDHFCQSADTNLKNSIVPTIVQTSQLALSPKQNTISNYESAHSPVIPTLLPAEKSPTKVQQIRTYSRKKKTPCNSASELCQYKPAVVDYQAPAVSPTLIIQQIPTHSSVSPYIESLPSQTTSNNIQYQFIATIDAQEKPQVPLTIQLQPQINIQPVIPTVLGTIIQPNGVEQLVVNTPTPTVEVLNQQPVYIANMNQPVYMGMETVISNTVMSSSQFVSGMMTGSSYSATTTQVFQASKPVVDLPPQSYIVVNTQSNAIPDTIPQNIYSPQSSQPWTYNYQETYKVKERTTYQQVTRKIIQEENKMDCLKIVNSTQAPIIMEKPVVQEVTVEKTHSFHKTATIPNLVNNINPLIVNSRNNHKPPIINNSIVVNELPKQITSECSYQSAEKLDLPVKLESINGKTYKEINCHQVDLAKLNCRSQDNQDSIKNCNSQEKKHICRNILDKPVKPIITKVNSNTKNCNFRVNIINKKTKSNPHYYSNVDISFPIPDSKDLNQLPLKKMSVDDNKPQQIENICSTEMTKPIRIPLKENKSVTNETKLGNNKIKNNHSINNNLYNRKLVYEISSPDGLSVCSQDLAQAWKTIFETVQTARAARCLPPLPQNPFISDLRILGLDNNTVKYLVEQLPGDGCCIKYKPVYHKNKVININDQPCENKTGCIRTEPYSITRRKYDMFSWLASRHRRPPKLVINSDTEIVNGISRRATSLNLPMAMRFRHLKETSKESVGVFRSDIHGRGLFCLRDIDSGEMVIEYAGEVIRAGLTDKRENYYTSKGIGCYMFRIDDQFVVDATMHGNAARFINHSCEPNCYSRVVDILGKKHILIFALRKIPQGEELTYDYKFPLEDDKITCHCLSRKCRKYLN